MNRQTNVFIDPALSILVPANTESLVGVRLDKIKETAVYKQYLAKRRFEVLDELATRTGLDPRKDFYELLITATSNDQMILVHGKFGDAFGKAPDLKIPETSRTRYKGYEIIGTDQGALVFLNSSVLAVAKPALLRTLIDNRDSAKAGLPPALEVLVNQVPYSAQFWAATVNPQNLARFPAGSNISNLNRVLDSLKSLMFAADLQEGVAIQASGEATNTAGMTAEQNAKQINELFRGLIGLGRLNTPATKPELLRFLDSVQAEAQGTKIRVSAAIPPALVDQAFKMLPEAPVNR
jgi:hypothetical protein